MILALFSQTTTIARTSTALAIRPYRFTEGKAPTLFTLMMHMALRCDDAGAGVEARRPANLRKTSSRTDLDATTGGPYDETPYDGGLRTTKTRRHFTLGMAP